MSNTSNNQSPPSTPSKDLSNKIRRGKRKASTSMTNAIDEAVNKDNN